MRAGLDHYRGLLRRAVAGRPWMSAMDVLVPAAQTCETLLDLGASRALAIGGSRGTGELPDPARVPHFDLGVSAPDMMSAIRAGEVALRAVPPEVQAAVDAFDPGREARVVGTLFCSHHPVAGRRIYGARPPAWQALEDKVSVDAFWDAAGITRAPSAVVSAELDALTTAAGRLDRGAGTVWAGDMRAGFNGGASYVRWVRTPEHAESAARFFSADCERVRVMPFLEGTPCSIHGVVIGHEVVALRPCEMIVFRRPGRAEFAYAAAATFWDPPASDRAAMREVARRAGHELARRVGYRGVFTVDGVLTEEGFRPTELNPRFGAAIAIMGGGLDGFPLYLLHLLIAEGEPFDFRAAELERVLLESADAHRRGHGQQVVARPVAERQTARLAFDGAWRVLDDPRQPADAEAWVGPHAAGGFVRIKLDPSRTPSGPAVAPRLAAALACVDAHWSLGIGPLEAALSVR